MQIRLICKSVMLCSVYVVVQLLCIFFYLFLQMNQSLLTAVAPVIINSCFVSGMSHTECVYETEDKKKKHLFFFFA